jgi:hypothetical protein
MDSFWSINGQLIPPTLSQRGNKYLAYNLSKKEFLIQDYFYYWMHKTKIKSAQLLRLSKFQAYIEGKLRCIKDKIESVGFSHTQRSFQFFGCRFNGRKTKLSSLFWKIFISYIGKKQSHINATNYKENEAEQGSFRYSGNDSKFNSPVNIGVRSYMDNSCYDSVQNVIFPCAV